MNSSVKNIQKRRALLPLIAGWFLLVAWVKNVTQDTNFGQISRLDESLSAHSSFNAQASDTETIQRVLTDDEHHFVEEKSNVPWEGIENAQWCQAPTEEPLPYYNCEWYSFVFRIPVYGGLTNALHFIMKGAIWSFEESVCFFVDEWHPTQSRLAAREPVENSITPFLERYFEPMGVSQDSTVVQNALASNSVITPSYHQIQQHEFGKFSGGLTHYDNPVRHKKRSLEHLNIYDVDSILMKKDFLRRFFRILPHFRELSCSRLSAHGLNDEYIALSVRRGDKALEYTIEESLQPYIEKAEIAINTHFDGMAPTFFVASDDCSVMQELRDLRPDWNIVGECDNATEDNGFVITDMKMWTEEQTDRHYEKFITEMIAMASAKYWIGVSTTNVSFWIYFMRHANAHDDTFAFVDVDQAVH